MTATIDAPVETTETTETPTLPSTRRWMGKQGVVIVTRDPEGSSLRVGDLCFVKNGVATKFTDRRRTTAHNEEDFLPLPEELLYDFASREYAAREGRGSSALARYDRESMRFGITIDADYISTAHDFRGKVWFFQDIYLVDRTLPDAEQRTRSWTWTSHMRVRDVNLFGERLLAFAQEWWASVPEPGHFREGKNGLLHGATIVYEDVPNSGVTEEVVVDGRRVITTTIPVQERIRVDTFAERSWVEETAMDFALRNGQRDSLRKMLRGDNITTADGRRINWKKDLVVVERDGVEYVSIESVKDFAVAGKHHFNWCGVADQVAAAVAEGKVMRDYDVHVSYATPSTRNRPEEGQIVVNSGVFRRRTHAHSSANAYAITRQAVVDWLNAQGFEATLDNVGEYTIDVIQ